jgi:G3E family GTPase
MIPVTLLTGYLGSGKTTVLNQLLQSPRLARTAVIVNEFGEIGIDHDLIETGSEKLVNLPGGCICCSVRSDLADTLRSLFQRRVRGAIGEFDRIIIETTGLAEPAPILQTLITDPLVSARFRLDGVIATVDAVNGWDTLDREHQARDQVALADRLLLTKTDLADTADADRLADRLHSLNPLAPILRLPGDFDTGSLIEVDAADRGAVLPAARIHHHHHDDIQSFCLVSDQAISPARFADWVMGMIGRTGSNLLRVKGLVNVAGESGPVVVHGVQHVFHPPVTLPAWPSEDRRTRVVFIGRNLDEQAIRDTLTR